MKCDPELRKALEELVEKWSHHASQWPDSQGAKAVAARDLYVTLSRIESEPEVEAGGTSQAVECPRCGGVHGVRRALACSMCGADVTMAACGPCTVEMEGRS